MSKKNQGRGEQRNEKERYIQGRVHGARVFVNRASGFGTRRRVCSHARTTDMTADADSSGEGHALPDGDPARTDPVECPVKPESEDTDLQNALGDKGGEGAQEGALPPKAGPGEFDLLKVIGMGAFGKVLQVRRGMMPRFPSSLSLSLAVFTLVGQGGDVASGCLSNAHVTEPVHEVTLDAGVLSRLSRSTGQGLQHFVSPSLYVTTFHSLSCRTAELAKQLVHVYMSMYTCVRSLSHLAACVLTRAPCTLV